MKPSIEERRIVIKQCKHSVEELPCKSPRRCFLTGKLLWFRPAVRVSRTIVSNYGTGHEQLQHFWVDPKEYTLLLLGKGQ